jgi:hypothetical protein
MSEEPKSDTPETDKEEGCRGYDDRWIKMEGGGDVRIEFAQKLERERDEARIEAERWREHWKNGRKMSMIVSSKFPWEK